MTRQFRLTIRSVPGRDATRELRALLKAMSRTYGFQCIGCASEPSGPSPSLPPGTPLPVVELPEDPGSPHARVL